MLKEEHSLPELRELIYEEYECSESDREAVNDLISEFLTNALAIGLILP